MRQTLAAGYVQDSWRFRPHLTINMGVRYEVLTIPTESQNKIALLHDLLDKAPRIGGPILDSNPTLRNFSPRIGFAWSPGKDSKTSVRAGFGIFDNLPLLYLFDTPLMRSFPFFTQGVITNVTAPGLYGSFPDQGYKLFSNGTPAYSVRGHQPARSYMPRWNFNVQRDLWGWVTTIGYVGSRGIRLVQVERNMNTVQPVATSAGWFYGPTATTQKLNPAFATINTTGYLERRFELSLGARQRNPING